MTTVDASEVALGIESFGDDDAAVVLLAGGTTMLSWPDAVSGFTISGVRIVEIDILAGAERLRRLGLTILDL